MEPLPPGSRSIAIANRTRGAVLAAHCAVARSFLDRFVGLMGRAGLPEDAGLLIVPCNSIHSAFMRFRFDAVFLDRQFRVVHLIRAMPPYRLSRIVFRAHSVLELPAGTVERTGTQVGDELAAVDGGTR
ncbi:MAG: DUF192 domain-containing protein [Chloroflexi bacterium]|nr:DUF192 domain-containing protein [Chloroflexota bacterium]